VQYIRIYSVGEQLIKADGAAHKGKEVGKVFDMKVKGTEVRRIIIKWSMQ